MIKKEGGPEVRCHVHRLTPIRNMFGTEMSICIYFYNIIRLL